MAESGKPDAGAEFSTEREEKTLAPRLIDQVNVVRLSAVASAANLVGTLEKAVR